MSSYQAIFFDAGFTILQISPSRDVLFQRVTHAHGLDYTLEEAQRANTAANSFFDAHYYQPNDTWTDDAAILAFWESFYRTALQAVQCPAGLLEPCARGLALLLNQNEVWRAYPEAAQVLASLKAAGYTVGILSDWASSLSSVLEAVGLRAHADFLVVSAVDRVAKPQPAFFRLALERAGVEPHQALMVGDNLYADIQGAAAAGIAGVLVDRAGRNHAAGVPTIRRLDELWALLELP